MGIPGLWPFINKHFGQNAVKTIQNKNSSKNFDYVYLDANGLLHSAAQTVFNYGPNKRFIDPNSNLTYEEKLKAVFELFFVKIEDVAAIVIPNKILYIAIDGPAPRAKQNQQRERRFVSAINSSDDPNAFDSNCISPGTEFMHELSKFMYFRIRKYVNEYYNRVSSKDIEVLYSQMTVAGEGEHKIMDYIRELPYTEKMNSSHCMFGPDGDLLMLTLSAHVNNISLFREDQLDSSVYHLIDMSRVRNDLSNVLNQSKEIKLRQRTKHDVSNDFVLMGFFVGNDFLPKIKMFYFLEDGLNKMINTYVNVSSSGFIRQYITNSSNNMGIDIEGFRLFVTELSKNEVSYIHSQRNTKVKDPKFIDTTLESCISANNELDMNEYRKKYYAKFGLTENDANIVCKEYFRNLIWVYMYYTEKLLSWEESYKYHYAPLMSDFKDYLDTISQNDVDTMKFDLSKPALPFEQLLSVLPAKSKRLLPEYYQPLMTHKNSQLVRLGYYPETFDIDFEGKRKDYQGVTLLPFVEYKYIEKAYNDRKNGKQLYNDEDVSDKRYKYHRNEHGKISSFKYDKNRVVNFQSVYGDIHKCNVNVN